MRKRMDDSAGLAAFCLIYVLAPSDVLKPQTVSRIRSGAFSIVRNTARLPHTFTHFLLLFRRQDKAPCHSLVTVSASFRPRCRVCRHLQGPSIPKSTAATERSRYSTLTWRKLGAIHTTLAHSLAHRGPALRRSVPLRRPRGADYALRIAPQTMQTSNHCTIADCICSTCVGNREGVRAMSVAPKYGLTFMRSSSLSFDY